jgi:hypothetical protein
MGNENAYRILSGKPQVAHTESYNLTRESDVNIVINLRVP